MKKPLIFVIDDDEQVLNAVVRDLKGQYHENYRIMATTSAKEALDSLRKLKNKNQVVAIFLSDQRMPDMLGVEFLEKARKYYPSAKRVLLTAYSDTEAAIKAINEVQLDYYLMKPWDPPQEKLFPVLDELLDDWQSNFKPDYHGIKIIGYQWSPKSHAIKNFLSGNLMPYQWLDVESNRKAADLLRINNVDKKDLPYVIFEDGSLLTNPSLQQVAEKTGMSSSAKKKVYDLAIIGAGPAGLAAAVYGGSEGLETILIERHSPGGQAGTSSRIENYLGFPNGLSGSELSRRAVAQAGKFGIELLSLQEVTDISLQGNYKILELGNGDKINAKSVLITTGVQYRKLNAENAENFTGAGVYYGSANTEAHACKDKDVYIIGGGNAAGQAAMHLSGYAGKVKIAIRKPGLSSSMSQYLIDQIEQTKNIELLPNTEVVEVKGNSKLDQLVLENNQSGEKSEVKAAALLIFIGSKPVTEWIKLNIIKNEKGFIETGNSLLKYEGYKKSWKLERKPYLLETCSPGIFAAGDVRAGAINRVASAVGEGAMAIKFVHEYLADH